MYNQYQKKHTKKTRVSVHLSLHKATTVTSAKTDDLPAVNFAIKKTPVKRKANSSLTNTEKMQCLLEEKSVAKTPTHYSPAKDIEIDVNYSSPESEPEKEVERIVIKPKSTIVKKDIKIDKLLKFLNKNICDILALPFSFKNQQFHNDDVACEYLDIYEEETNAVIAELKKHDPTLRIMNVQHQDRLYWLSAKTVERFIEYETENKASRKTEETSPNRKKIRDDVRKNLSISAQRMTDCYSKRKRMVVKEFRMGENVAVRVPIQDRAKTDARRVPVVIVQVKGANYKLACRYRTISGYFSTSDLISYPGNVAIANEDNEISLRTAAKQQSQQKSDVFFCKCRKSCKSKHCKCLKKGLSCNGRCHSGKSCKNNVILNNVSISNSRELTPKVLVKYGGQIGSEYFSNTCPVDNFLAMLCLIREEYSESFTGLLNISSDDYSEFILLLHLYVCMPFYVVHYHNNLMKAHHYHKSHQISSASLEKMNIIILVFK